MTLTSTSHRLTRLLVALVIALAGVVGTSAASAGTASALCASQPMVGNWYSTDPNTRSLTRVNVGFVCGDVRLCDTSGHCTGGESYFTLRPFGKCSPTDCDWGTKQATAMGDGWQRAIYTHSWSTKYVWVKTYVFGSTTYLRVYTFTDFTAADGRTDYTTDQWMLK
ncbi:MAG: hypothetical protein QM619_09145 [Micropruina sp.]|uniref:hypothetical protein n=1 Tax=Micropruina sp. TaxID=2737536 RepID=UPI0039E4C473